MGSRMMHLIIPNETAKKCPIKNKNLFLLGGLAPDAVTTDKEASHFYRGKHKEYTRRIAYEEFYDKYSDHPQQDYILGYYCHLIADDLWLTGFFSPWLKNRIETHEEILKKYHYDLYLLNGKLDEYNGVNTSVVRNLNVPTELSNLVEVKKDELNDFLPFLLDDFNYNKAETKQPLNVFTFDQIVGYIETAVEKSLYYLNNKTSIYKNLV